MKISISSALEKGSSDEQLRHSQMLGLRFSSSMTLSFRLEQVLCIKDMQVWQGIAEVGWDTVFVQTAIRAIIIFMSVFKLGYM